MTVTIQSVQALSLGADLLDKLAARHGVSAYTLAKKHVLFLDDTPNEANSNSEAYEARVVTTAVILDKPVKLEVAAVGSAIKSPDDKYDAQRGRTITFSRAVRALGDK